jgi:Protein of unknown function (DUF2975)
MKKSFLVDVTRVLLVVAIAAELLVVASFLLGQYGVGLDLPSLGRWHMGEGEAVMHAEGTLALPPAIDIDLDWTDTSNGTVDASTGLAPVSIDGPFHAFVTIWSPTPSERAAYVTVKVLGPLLSVIVMLILLRFVSSVRTDTPFTKRNAKRLWTIAGLVGAGGMAVVLANAWISDYLISRSAAAAAFNTGRLSFSVWPLLVALLIAVVAITWDRGAILEDDTRGLV